MIVSCGLFRLTLATRWRNKTSIVFRKHRSYGWQQDEAGADACGSRTGSVGCPAGARQNGAALSESPRVSAVHTLWNSSAPHPGDAAHHEQPPPCHPCYAVPHVRQTNLKHTQIPNSFCI